MSGVDVRSRQDFPILRQRFVAFTYQIVSTRSVEMGHRYQGRLGVFHFGSGEKFFCRSLSFARCQQHFAILEVDQIERSRNRVADRAVVQ